MKEPDAFWDAGDMGCGELLLELRFRMAELSRGQVMKLIASDSGAPEDIPAWCKLTGQRLLANEHRQYWIEKT